LEVQSPKRELDPHSAVCDANDYGTIAGRLREVIREALLELTYQGTKIGIPPILIDPFQIRPQAIKRWQLCDEQRDTHI
jgi:hypothetical protein